MKNRFIDHNTKDKKFIVVSGNLSEGFCVVGPFKTFDKAADSLAATEPNSWIMPICSEKTKKEKSKKNAAK